MIRAPLSESVEITAFRSGWGDRFLANAPWVVCASSTNGNNYNADDGGFFYYYSVPSGEEYSHSYSYDLGGMIIEGTENVRFVSDLEPNTWGVADGESCSIAREMDGSEDRG